MSIKYTQCYWNVRYIHCQNVINVINVYSKFFSARQKKNVSKNLSSARVTGERAFGILQVRWDARIQCWIAIKGMLEIRLLLILCVCVCVCVCMYLYSFTARAFSVCNDVWDILEEHGWTVLCCEYDSRCFCQVLSSVFLKMSYLTYKDETSTWRQTGEKTTWYIGSLRIDDIYWYRI